MASSKGVLTFWLLALAFRAGFLSLLTLLQDHLMEVIRMIHIPPGLIM